ncbi:MAG TPA: hypothetical protein VFE62_16080 [Gemmataceae bacterium]|nr:hypothetical protein [Gemmataceae bacterium]
MMVPGSGMLNTALSVIAAQPFQYFPFAARTTQGNGQYLSTYQAPQTVRGSVQAVPRNLYQEYGLNFQRNYFKFFLSRKVMDVSRDTSGDMFVFQCKNFQVLSITPWHGIDGWVEVLAIEVPTPPTVG